MAQDPDYADDFDFDAEFETEEFKDLSNKLLKQDLANPKRLFLTKDHKAKYNHRRWDDSGEFLTGVIGPHLYHGKKAAFIRLGGENDGKVLSMRDVGGAHIRMAVSETLKEYLEELYDKDDPEDRAAMSRDLVKNKKTWDRVKIDLIKKQKVTCAGTIWFNKDDNKYVIDGDSGHFKPQQEIIDKFIEEAQDIAFGDWEDEWDDEDDGLDDLEEYWDDDEDDWDGDFD